MYERKILSIYYRAKSYYLLKRFYFRTYVKKKKDLYTLLSGFKLTFTFISVSAALLLLIFICFKDYYNE